MLRKRKIPLLYKFLLSNFLIIFSLIIVLLVGRELIISKAEVYMLKDFQERINNLETDMIKLLSHESEGQNNHFRITSSFESNYGFMYKVYDENNDIIIDTSKVYDQELKRVIEEYKFEKDKMLIFEETRKLYSEDENGSKKFLGTLVINYALVKGIPAEGAKLIKQFVYIYHIMLATIVVIILIISFLISRSITKPIQKIIKKTHSIRQGELSTRVKLRTSTTEIIELKEAINYLANSLEEEDQLRRQMTSDMAHEIRTPLNNVQNILEALIDGIWEKSDENLEKCYQESRRLSQLVDKLKNIATIEEENLLIQNECFDCVAYTKELVNLFEAEAMKKDVQIKLQADNQLNVFMDKGKYAQVIGNLLSNSIRYSNNGGVIIINLLNLRNEYLVLKVRDYGLGIETEHLQRVFERFYRTDESRNKETGGLGLGLTITKKIVEIYKGTITVKSKVNEGAEFEVQLPIICED